MEGKKPVWKRFELKKRSRTLKKHAQRVESVTTRHAHRFLISRWDKIREVRLHIILWMAGVGALIAVVGLQMVWFQQSYVTRATASGGTYAEAVKGSIKTLNPLFARTPAELSASHLLFSSLYSMDTTGHLKGDIAKKMVNDADKTFTVTLRRDARWHDGQKLTAEDVVFTVGLMKNPVVRSTMLASWQGVNVEKVNDYSVKFTLPAAYAAFPQALSFAILPHHLLKSADPAALREVAFSNAPVGSGPFRLRLLQTINQSADRKVVHLDANNTYYAGSPRLDRLQLHTYKNDQNIGTAIRTGEVTGASDVASDVAASLDKTKYESVVRPLNNGVYVILNTTQPALKERAVRYALQIGTDTAAVRQKVYGQPKDLYLPFIPYQVAGSDAIAKPTYSSAAANAALDADGWVVKDGVRTKGATKLRLKVVTRKNADYEAVLQELVQQWRKLGVQVDTQIFDTNDPTQDFTLIQQQRSYDVLLDELTIGGDPDVFAYWNTKGLLNFSNYSNPLADDALASARTRSDSVLRAVKYAAFAKQWLTDAPAIGLYQPNYIYVHNKTTNAVQPDETIVSSADHFANVRNWTAKQDFVYKTP